MKIKSPYFLVIIACVLVGFYGGYSLLWPLWIKKYGLELTPTKVIEPKQVEFFLQNDKRWGSDHLGNTKSSLSTSGCLIACLASAINTLDTTQHISPRKTNRALLKNAGFTEDGMILWANINKAFPRIDYNYTNSFHAELIEKDLEAGNIPVIKVKYKGDGIFHWVLIVGSNEEDFLLMDPLEQSKKPIPLHVHGPVYSYRTLILASKTKS